MDKLIWFIFYNLPLDWWKWPDCSPSALQLDLCWSWSCKSWSKHYDTLSCFFFFLITIFAYLLFLLLILVLASSLLILVSFRIAYRSICGFYFDFYWSDLFLFFPNNIPFLLLLIPLIFIFIFYKFSLINCKLSTRIC